MDENKYNLRHRWKTSWSVATYKIKSEKDQEKINTLYGKWRGNQKDNFKNNIKLENILNEEWEIKLGTFQTFL